jgi:hypothetical protein
MYDILLITIILIILAYACTRQTTIQPPVELTIQPVAEPDIHLQPYTISPERQKIVDKLIKAGAIPSWGRGN